MRSKVVERILANTPDPIKHKVDSYAKLLLSDVSGSLPCHHNFIQKDTYWKSCTHCGMIAPLGQ